MIVDPIDGAKDWIDKSDTNDTSNVFPSCESASGTIITPIGFNDPSTISTTTGTPLFCGSNEIILSFLSATKFKINGVDEIVGVFDDVNDVDGVVVIGVGPASKINTIEFDIEMDGVIDDVDDIEFEFVFEILGDGENDELLESEILLDNEIEILELSLIDDVTDSLLDDDGDLDSDGVIDNELECEIEILDDGVIDDEWLDVIETLDVLLLVGEFVFDGEFDGVSLIVDDDDNEILSDGNIDPDVDELIELDGDSLGDAEFDEGALEDIDDEGDSLIDGDGDTELLSLVELDADGVTDDVGDSVIDGVTDDDEDSVIEAVGDDVGDSVIDGVTDDDEDSVIEAVGDGDGLTDDVGDSVLMVLRMRLEIL